MPIIETAYIQKPDYFNMGNGQDIREALLRHACKHCKHYATDIIVFFESKALKDLLESDSGTVTIWFRDYGVDWGAEPDKFNSVLRLVKRGNFMELEEGESK